MTPLRPLTQRLTEKQLERANRALAAHGQPPHDPKKRPDLLSVFMSLPPLETDAYIALIEDVRAAVSEVEERE